MPTDVSLLRFVTVLVIAPIVPSLAGCRHSSEGVSLESQYDSILAQPNPEIRVRELVELATTQAQAGDRGGARRSLRSAAAACQEITDSLGRTNAYNQLAHAHGTLKSRHEAKQSLVAADAAAQQCEDGPDKVEELCKIARNYAGALANQDAAITRLKAAEELANSLDGSFEESSALSALSYSYDRLGMRDSADELVARSLRVARSIQQFRRRVEALSGIATRLHLMERLETSRTVFEEAGSAAKRIPSQESKGYALIHLASKHQLVGQRSTAQEFLDDAEDLALAIDDNSIRTPLLEQIAQQRRNQSN